MAAAPKKSAMPAAAKPPAPKSAAPAAKDDAKPAKDKADKPAAVAAKPHQHKIVDVSIETLEWGKIAPRDMLPPPDVVVRCRLINSAPEVHNMLRRAAMNSLRVYALAHVSIVTDDRYVGRDETRARVGLIRIRQADAKWGARTVLKLKVTNETSDILPVTTESFVRSDGVREPGFVGVARIATLAPGCRIEISCEVQLATASVGAGHRATGCFRAYGLDYQNVGTIDSEGKPGSAWVKSSELRALTKADIHPTETPVLVVAGAERRVVSGSATRYFTVPALPAAHSSTNTADANFGLEFRLEACWNPSTFLGLVAKRLVEVLQEMRDVFVAGSVAVVAETPECSQYTFETFDKCYGGLLRVMIAEMAADVFTNYTCIHQHTDGFRIRIAHPKSAELLLAAIQRAITLYEGII